jgi:hypothetical protein
MPDKNTIAIVSSLLALLVVTLAFLKLYRLAWVVAGLDVVLLVYAYTRRDK